MAGGRRAGGRQAGVVAGGRRCAHLAEVAPFERFFLVISLLIPYGRHL